MASNPNFANMTETEKLALLSHAGASENAGKWINYLVLQKKLNENGAFLNQTSQEIEVLLGLAKAAGLAANTVGKLSRNLEIKNKLNPGQHYR